VKVWNEQSQLFQTIEAYSSSEVKFIYGLCFLPGANDNLDRSQVSCGLVRVQPGRRHIQEIPHPERCSTLFRRLEQNDWRKRANHNACQKGIRVCPEQIR
jgi:hypothetical protein